MYVNLLEHCQAYVKFAVNACSYSYCLTLLMVNDVIIYQTSRRDSDF